MSSTIAFIGLGIMGAPMARHLVEAGHTVIGVNRSPEPVQALVEAGGEAGEDVAAAVSSADVVITMLPDSPDVEEVLLGEDGVLANAASGSLLIDFSTIRPDVARNLAEAAAEKDLALVDAPVSGGQAGAEKGALSIMVGGDEEAVERARAFLEVVGDTVVHVGPAGSGQTVKAANQLIVAGNIQLVAEAIVFLEAHGVAMEPALEVLGGGLAGSTVLDGKGSSMLAREFEPGFRVDLHHKDLGIVTSAAREAGVVIPLGAQVAQLMAGLRAAGHGSEDHSALLRLVETLSGRTAGSDEQG